MAVSKDGPIRLGTELTVWSACVSCSLLLPDSSIFWCDTEAAAAAAYICLDQKPYADFIYERLALMTRPFRLFPKVPLANNAIEWFVVRLRHGSFHRSGRLELYCVGVQLGESVGQSVRPCGHSLISQLGCGPIAVFCCQPAVALSSLFTVRTLEERTDR